MMVGKIIIPSSRDAVSRPLPEEPVSFCTMGTITTSPKKPYTMEGIPAIRSTAGFTTRYSPLGQKRAR